MRNKVFFDKLICLVRHIARSLQGQLFQALSLPAPSEKKVAELASSELAHTHTHLSEPMSAILKVVSSLTNASASVGYMTCWRGGAASEDLFEQRREQNAPQGFAKNTLHD